MSSTESLSKVTFHFVNSNSLAKPAPKERKVIKSHVARGTGRPKRATAQFNPRIGSWLKGDVESYKRELIGMRSNSTFMSCMNYSKDRVLGKSNRTGANEMITLDASLSQAPSFYVLSSSPDMAPGMLDRIYRALTQLTQAIYPASFCAILDQDMGPWCKYLNQDAAHQYIYPLVAESYNDMLDGTQCSLGTSRLLAKVIPLIQQNIEDPTRAAADSTISAIIALATVADIVGDFETLRKHASGLQSLIALRGGIQQLQHGELQSKCCRIDLQTAISTGCEPFFFSESISWDPYFTHTSTSQHVSQPPVLEISSLVKSSNPILDSRIENIWHDAQELCAIINLAHLTQRKLQGSLFQESMVSLQYRLLQLHQTPQIIPPNSLHEAVRLGILAFTTSVFLKTIDNSMRYLDLATSLKVALNALDVQQTPQDWELRLWILVVTAILIFNSGKRSKWLREKLHTATTELQVSSWLELKVIMKKFLWIDTIHDTQGKNIFLWCILEGV